jgi:hypothetical protein
MVVMDVTSPNESVWNNGVHNLADLINTCKGQIVDARKPGSYILAPVNPIRADEFLETTTLNDSIDNPWPGVLIYVQGPASTAILAVEVVIHLEVTLTSASGSTLGGKSEPNAFLSSVSKKLKSTFIEGGKKQVENVAQRIVRGLVGTAATALGTFFGGPVGGALTGGAAGYLLQDGPHIEEVD